MPLFISCHDATADIAARWSSNALQETFSGSSCFGIQVQWFSDIQCLGNDIVTLPRTFLSLKMLAAQQRRFSTMQNGLQAFMQLTRVSWQEPVTHHDRPDLGWLHNTTSEVLPGSWIGKLSTTSWRTPNRRNVTNTKNPNAFDLNMKSVLSHFTCEGSGLPTDGKICWFAGEGRSLLCWQVLVLMNLMIHWWFTDDSLMIMVDAIGCCADGCSDSKLCLTSVWSLCRSPFFSPLTTTRECKFQMPWRVKHLRRTCAFFSNYLWFPCKVVAYML